MLKKWGIWIIGFVLMVTPLLILLFFWIAIQRAADSLSEGIGEVVLARSQAREAARPPQPAGDGDAGSAYSPDGPTEPSQPATVRPATATSPEEAPQNAATAPEATGANRNRVKPTPTTRATQPRVKPARAPARPSTRARASTRPPGQPPDLPPTSLVKAESLEKLREVSDLIDSPSPESRNSLIRMLNGDDPMMRVLAAQGLSSYQDDHILRIITAAANRETDPSAERDLDQIAARLRKR